MRKAACDACALRLRRAAPGVHSSSNEATTARSAHIGATLARTCMHCACSSSRKRRTRRISSRLSRDDAQGGGEGIPYADFESGGVQTVDGKVCGADVVPHLPSAIDGTHVQLRRAQSMRKCLASTTARIAGTCRPGIGCP
jgi:hypothetical protein